MLFEALASGGGSDWYYTILMKAPLGSDITIDDGNEEVTAVGAGDTIIGIPVHNPSSTYNISVVASGFTKTSSATTPATSGGISSLIEVQFGEIDLTFDDEFRGLSATITNEAGTKTATITLPSTGNAETIFVPDLGKWIISSTVSGDTFTAEATIGSFSVPESAELAVIPNGKTVLPVNSIEKWLLCGNIKNKSYTTLAEVLADEDTLRKLLTDDNAIDYLKRSTEWAVNPGLIPMATGDDPTHIKSSHDHAPDGAMAYYAYYAFDRNDNTRWNGSNTTNEEWLEYDFDTPTCVRRIYIKPCIYSSKKMVKHAYFQAYDTTQSDWISLKEISLANDSVEEYYFDIDNNTNYTRYRLLCDESYYIEGSYYGFSIWELQFYTYAECITESELAMSYIGAYDYAANELLDDATWREAIINSEYIEDVCNTVVPTMTSNTQPEGECFGSGIEGANYDFYKAFDGSPLETSAWYNTNGVTTNGYVGYHFPKTFKLYHAKFLPQYVSSNNTTYVKNWKLQVSDDNVDWTRELASGLATNGVSSWQDIPVSNPQTCNYARIFVLDTYSPSSISIREIQFYGREAGGVQTLLKAAGISKPYTTIDELLADHVTLQKVISSHDAIDYLVTAKSFIDAFTSDATAMRYIGKRNYAADTLLSDTNFGLIPEMTDSTHPSGRVTSSSVYSGYNAYDAFNTYSSPGWVPASNDAGWVQYSFDNPINVKGIKIKGCSSSSSTVYQVKIYGSNDGFTTPGDELGTINVKYGNTVNELTIENDQSYSDYRVVHQSSGASQGGDGIKIQFYGKPLEQYWFEAIINSEYFESVLNTKVPTMTGYTTPEGEVRDSNTYSNNYGWHIFDKDAPSGNDRWETEDGHITNEWVDYHFSSKIKPYYFEMAAMYASGNQQSRVKSYKIQGSNDAFVNEIVDLTETLTSPNVLAANYYAPLQKVFATKNIDEYEYVRILVLDTWANNVGWPIGINYAQFYGREDVDESKIDVYGAAGAAVSYKNGSSWDALCTLDATTDKGHAVIDATDLPTGVSKLLFKTDVAKDPDNLTADYTKEIDIFDDMIEISIMPDGALYWYGYEDAELEDMTTANGWSYNALTLTAPTHNTQNISLSGSASTIRGIASKKSKKVNSVNAIADCITADSGIYGWVSAVNNKILNSATSDDGNFTASGMQYINHKITLMDSGYVDLRAGKARNMTAYALWASKPNPLANFFSAAKDTVYYLENNVQVVVAKTDEFGGAVVDFNSIPANATLYSSVAKDPTDATLQTAFSKQFVPSGSKFYLMPAGALYWWGYENGIEAITTANGWSCSYSLPDPTFADDHVRLTSASNNCGIGSKKTYNNVTNYVIAQGITQFSSDYGSLGKAATKNLDDHWSNPVSIDTNTLKLYSNTITSENYISVSTNSGRVCDVYAVWVA